MTRRSKARTVRSGTTYRVDVGPEERVGYAGNQCNWQLAGEYRGLRNNPPTELATCHVIAHACLCAEGGRSIERILHFSVVDALALYFIRVQPIGHEAPYNWMSLKSVGGSLP